VRSKNVEKFLYVSLGAKSCEHYGNGNYKARALVACFDKSCDYEFTHKLEAKMELYCNNCEEKVSKAIRGMLGELQLYGLVL